MKKMLELTPSELGRRILERRKVKGISQKELASQIGLSRTALVQIEKGNRSLSTLEFHKMSQVLHFSLDQFLSKDYSSDSGLKNTNSDKNPEEQIRISIPEFQLEKFKHVLLYILQKCAGKPNVGETVLYKLLYFSDFNYYELFEEHLTGTQYRKLPFGPVPYKIDFSIQEMIEAGWIQRVKTNFHGFSQTRYLPLEEADLSQLNANEKVVIDRVISQFSSWSASALSDYSHQDMPWKASKDGEVIDYELAFYRTPPYSVRNYTR